jgi:hypothetical protein
VPSRGCIREQNIPAYVVVVAGAVLYHQTIITVLYKRELIPEERREEFEWSVTLNVTSIIT